MKENVNIEKDVLTLGKFIEICMKQGIPLNSEIKVDLKRVSGMGYKDNIVYLKSDFDDMMY